VIFVRDSQNHYSVRPVNPGRRDGEFVEVRGSGIKGGETYVSGNSFVLKAEMGKGEAGHDH
jgi:cobalt-zinc-cadmium efflux system membrane fusion protein